MMNKKFDILVVGQGVAGTCIAFQFLNAGKSVLVIDPDKNSSASLVASGIINPVTGRHFVKSWNFDILWDYLLSFYPKIENLIGLRIFEKLTVFRALATVKDYNDWMMREEDPELVNLIDNSNSLDQFSDYYTSPNYFTSFKGGRVDTESLVKGFRNYLCSIDCLLKEEFIYDDLIIEVNYIKYRDIVADKIVFCEGYKASTNPYFDKLYLNPFKGNVLIFDSDRKLPNDILKNELFFVPITNNKLWVGTKNSYKLDSEDPDFEYLDELQSKAQHLLKKGFTFDKYLAGIRPSVKDRRPLLGVHPQYLNMFIFNGLGSKGTSLAPYYSQSLYDFIEKGETLPSEVNISRFEK